MSEKKKLLDKYDVIALIGLALFVIGVGRFSWPAAMMVLGACLLFYAFQTVPPKPKL